MENEDPREPDQEAALVTLARMSGHGATLALSTGLFLLLGWWVDGRIGTRPLFTILGAMIGAGAGFYSILQHLLLRPRARERERSLRAPDDRQPPP